MEYVIKTNGLKKKFSNKIALKGVNLAIKRGEIFGLLGPSGSGKTTTINILTGQMSATKGNIEVLGRADDLLKAAKFRGEIGILSDNSSLYERLTVYDNLKLFCKLYDVAVDNIDEMLELVNMTDERKTTVSKMSRGMKQRILLCKALIHKPKLVFLDEPTSALDPGNVIHIHNGLKKLNELGTTIFLTTHNMEEATTLCDRVAFLHDGEIKEVGNPIDLRFKYSTNDFHIKTYDGNSLTIENKAENAGKVSELISTGNLKAIHSDFPTLGDVFLKITGEELSS